MDLIMPVFSQRLRMLRAAKGVTQSYMAELLGCSSRRYQMIEHGQLNIPALTLVQLADFFDVSADYLLGRSDERQLRQAQIKF